VRLIKRDFIDVMTGKNMRKMTRQEYEATIRKRFLLTRIEKEYQSALDKADKEFYEKMKKAYTSTQMIQVGKKMEAAKLRAADKRHKRSNDAIVKFLKEKTS